MYPHHFVQNEENLNLLLLYVKKNLKMFCINEHLMNLILDLIK